MNSYKKSFTSGLKWTTIQQIIVVALGIIKLMILARLLDKSTFGLFAIIMLLIGFTSIFSDLGITVSLYHKKKITVNQYSTLYWLNIILNVVIYIILILLTPIFILYFKEDALSHLVPITGLNLIFTAMGKHYKVYAEKELRFKNIAIITIFTSLLGLISATILALLEYEIYSLIYSILLTSLLSSLSFFILMRKRYKMKFIFIFEDVKYFFKVGIYQTGSQILDYLSSQLDIIIIGGLLDTEILGAYNLIKQFSQRIYRLMSNIINKVSIPIFSSFNNDEDLLKNRYLNIVDQISFISAIVYAGFAFMSKEILFILYGESYVQYHFLFSSFSLMFFIYSVISLASILIIAKGKTQYGFYWTIYRIIISTPLIGVLGYYYSIKGIVLGLTIFSLQSLYTYWLIVIKKVQHNIDFKTHFNSFYSNLIMLILIFIIPYLIISIFQFDFIVLFFIKPILFSLTTYFYVFFYRRRMYNNIIRFIKKPFINTL